MVPESDRNCLTIDDVRATEQGLPLQEYDVMLLFSFADSEFAIRMIKKLETFRLKLCVIQRDLLGGVTFEHDAIRNLINGRCNRLLVILSPDFLSSSLNIYASNLALALGIAKNKRVLIPVLYRQCEVPEIFQHINVIDYEKSSVFGNFWPILKASLQNLSVERRAHPLNLVTNLEQLSIHENMERATNSSLQSCRRIAPHQRSSSSATTNNL